MFRYIKTLFVKGDVYINERWFNLYPNHITGPYQTEANAIAWQEDGCLGHVKLAWSSDGTRL